MHTSHYQVEAFWDDEAKTWVATSENIIGLVTEAETLENLTQKLRLLIPELLLLNNQISSNYIGTISFEIVSRREELIEVNC